MFHRPKKEEQDDAYQPKREQDLVKDEDSQGESYNPYFEEILNRKKKKKKKSYKKKTDRDRNSYDNAFEDLTKPKPKFFEAS